MVLSFVITHPYQNFDGGLTKSSLKLGCRGVHLTVLCACTCISISWCWCLFILFLIAEETHLIEELPHMDGLVQERHSYIANALELRLSCTNPAILRVQVATLHLHQGPMNSFYLSACFISPNASPTERFTKQTTRFLSSESFDKLQKRLNALTQNLWKTRNIFIEKDWNPNPIH